MVHTRFDGFGKGMVRDALEPRGMVETEAEVAAETRWIDLWFTPDPTRVMSAEHLGLLGRMTASASTLEFFHAPPNGNELTTCVIKHGQFCRFLLQRRPLTPIPVLWVVSAGRPDTGIQGLSFRPKTGWPSGVYDGPPLLWTGLVVVSELPVVRDTLLVRLLGADRVLREAIAELKALPEGAPERALALPALLRSRLDVPADPVRRTSDDEEFLMTTQDIVETWRRQALEEGAQQGFQRGLQQGLRGVRNSFQHVYEARFGALPDAMRAVVQDTADEATLGAWLRLATTAGADEIAAAIGRAGRSGGAHER